MDNSGNDIGLKNKAQQLEVSMARFMRTPSQIESKKEISISEIINLNDIEELMKAFHDATDLGVGIFNKSNKLIASAGWQKICTHFHQKNPESKQSCKESEAYFKNNFEPNKAISYKCNNGLWDIAYPIYIDDDFLGSIFFGQFFYDDEKIDKTFFLKRAKKFNFDAEAYIEELKNIPILNKEKVESFVKLFVKIIEKSASVGEL